MSDYRTNYFGSFLDSMNATTPLRSAPEASPATSGAGTADAVFQALLRGNGTANVKDLLAFTGGSVDLLLAALNTLNSFGFVARDGANVEITPAGRQAAAARPAA